MKPLFIACIHHAKNKLDNHPQYDAYPHFSFLIVKNKILSVGVNRPGEPPLHYGYHDRINDPAYIPKIHSEIDAWRKARDLIDGKFFIVNIRLSRVGEMRNSTPCRCCYELLKSLGCSKFFFSTEIGTFSILK